MATQRRVWAPTILPRLPDSEVRPVVLLIRYLCGLVIPTILLLAFGLAVSDGDVFLEGGRRFGPINAYHLQGLGCVLYGLFGLLLSVGIGLRGWTIGCKSDSCRDMNHLGVLMFAGAAFVGALLADAFVRGG